MKHVWALVICASLVAIGGLSGCGSSGGGGSTAQDAPPPGQRDAGGSPPSKNAPQPAKH